MTAVNLDAHLHRPGSVAKGDSRELKVVGFCNDDVHSDEQTEFILAMEKYKKINRRRYPTWSEALWVLKKLGYKK